MFLKKEKKKDGRKPAKENKSLTKFYSYNLKKSLQFSVSSILNIFKYMFFV